MTGLAIGAGLGFALTRTYLFDLAPAVLALAVLVGMLAGEALTARPLRSRGVASLRPRRLRDYLSRPVVAAVLLLGGGIQSFTLLRLPDRPDHENQYFGKSAPVSLVSTKVTLAVVVVLAVVAVWLIARSAQTGADETERAADEAWRQAAVQRIMHSCVALFALVFTALGFWYADSQMDWRGGGSPTWGVVLSVLSGIGLVVFARYASALVLGGATPLRTSTRPQAGSATNVPAR
jgi:hypothetical protein